MTTSVPGHLLLPYLLLVHGAMGEAISQFTQAHSLDEVLDIQNRYCKVSKGCGPSRGHREVAP